MFAVLLVGSFLPPLDFFIVNVALPSIQTDLGTSSSAEQMVISSYAGLYAVTLITGGRLGDLYGRSRMFMLGLIGFTAASLLCGTAWSPWALIVGRALQGFTAAIMAPQALASVHAMFPESEKPLALSLYGAVFGLAAVIGQVLGGVLISLDLFGVGWRMVFLVNLPIAVLVLAFGTRLLKNTQTRYAGNLDLGGMVLSVLSLALLIVPLTEGREAGWPLWSWLSLSGAVLLGWRFWRYEERLARNGGIPLINPAVLRVPGLGQAIAIALSFYSLGSFFLLFSIYLQSAIHVNALDAGLVFLPFGVGYLLGPLASPVCRKFLGDYVNPVGMGMESLGLGGLVLLINATPTGAVPASLPLATMLFLVGFGQGFAMPILMRMITSRVDPAFSGMIAGVASSTLQLSTALSVAIIGGIFYAVLDVRTSSEAISQAFSVAVLCIAFCLAIGVILGIRLIHRDNVRIKARPATPTSHWISESPNGPQIKRRN